MTSRQIYSGIDDFRFFRAVTPALPYAEYKAESPVLTFTNQFDPTESRVAGALTTARFFNRYNTTEINKNRKRAAAVFNIFLCDAMEPSIPEPSANPDDLLDKAFPGGNTMTEEDLRAESPES